MSIEVGDTFWSRRYCDQIMDDEQFSNVRGWPMDVDGTCYDPDLCIPDLPGVDLAALFGDAA